VTEEKRKHADACAGHQPSVGDRRKRRIAL
jgi:hypothetical protein